MVHSAKATKPQETSKKSTNPTVPKTEQPRKVYGRYVESGLNIQFQDDRPDKSNWNPFSWGKKTFGNKAVYAINPALRAQLGPTRKDIQNVKADLSRSVSNNDITIAEEKTVSSTPEPNEDGTTKYVAQYTVTVSYGTSRTVKPAETHNATRTSGAEIELNGKLNGEAKLGQNNSNTDKKNKPGGNSGKSKGQANGRGLNGIVPRVLGAEGKVSGEGTGKVVVGDRTVDNITYTTDKQVGDKVYYQHKYRIRLYATSSGTVGIAQVEQLSANGQTSKQVYATVTRTGTGGYDAQGNKQDVVKNGIPGRINNLKFNDNPIETKN